MSALRQELHELVDQLPDERLEPVLALVRVRLEPGRRAQALATLDRVRQRMRGVTGADEEFDQLRDGSRG